MIINTYTLPGITDDGWYCAEIVVPYPTRTKIVDWCYSNFGKHGERWNQNYPAFRFLNYKDYTLFLLKWA